MRKRNCGEVKAMNFTIEGYQQKRGLSSRNTEKEEIFGQQKHASLRVRKWWTQKASMK